MKILPVVLASLIFAVPSFANADWKAFDSEKDQLSIDNCLYRGATSKATDGGYELVEYYPTSYNQALKRDGAQVSASVLFGIPLRSSLIGSAIHPAQQEKFQQIVNGQVPDSVSEVEDLIPLEMTSEWSSGTGPSTITVKTIVTATDGAKRAQEFKFVLLPGSISVEKLCSGEADEQLLARLTRIENAIRSLVSRVIKLQNYQALVKDIASTATQSTQTQQSQTQTQTQQIQTQR